MSNATSDPSAAHWAFCPPGAAMILINVVKGPPVSAKTDTRRAVYHSSLRLSGRANLCRAAETDWTGTHLPNHALTVLTCDPEAFHVETPKATWILFGAGTAEKERFGRRVITVDDGIEKFCRSLADTTIIRVALEQARPVGITVWRGISSPCEVFYAIRKSGQVILADYFSNLLAQLPLEERATSDSVAVDHCLFRTVPVTGTYCVNVRRVGHGERFSIALNTGAIDNLQFDRVELPSQPDDVAAYVKGIDAALESMLTPLSSETGVANLFSGGVDSTLIQSYLGKQVPAIYVEREVGSFAYERDYASNAARLLGAELQEVAYSGWNYLEDLAVTTKDIGTPICLLQWPFFRSVVTQLYRNLIIGIYADGLFGFGVKTARVAKLFVSRPGIIALELARPLLALTPRLKSLGPAAAQLLRTVSDPYGYAGQTFMTADLNLVHAAFGPDLVKDRLAKRLRYVIDHAPEQRDNVSAFLRHFELAHWGTYFCGDHATQFRQLGLAHGKTVAVPFHTSAMMAAAARIPPEKRYFRGLNGKYLLKRLLKNRVPDYPINQRKGASLLPFATLCKDTTLSQIWERYDLPDWCTGDLKARVMDPRDGLSRDAITWAVWEREVLRNPDLRIIEATRELSWAH